MTNNKCWYCNSREVVVVGSKLICKDVRCGKVAHINFHTSLTRVKWN